MNELTPPSRKPHASFLAGLAVALSVAACGGGGGGDDKVSLDKPDDLMAALDNKVTANGTPLTQILGTPPPSTGLTPKIQSISNATAVPGNTVSLPINFPAATNLQSLFAKVPGAKDSYFQISVESPDSGGKAATGGFTVLQRIEFQVTVPDNLDLGTGDQFCIEVKLKDTAENIGQPEQACISLAATAPPAPEDDQPSASELDAKLSGSWATNCINIESDEAQLEGNKGVKLVLGFLPDQVYRESFEFFPDTDCAGSPSETLAGFLEGVWNAEDSVYSEQARRWQRPFTFNPNDPDPDIDLEPCYNVLSFNADATQLYLGLPNTFTIDDESGRGPMPGDCSEEDTRPVAVLTGLPFVKR